MAQGLQQQGDLGAWCIPTIRGFRDVNKFHLYRQIREELAAHYDKELRNVSALLQEGVEFVAGPKSRVACSKTETLVASGDANKVFREELSEAIRLILERYHRSLSKEVETLGLSFEKDSWTETKTELGGSQNLAAGSVMQNRNGAEPH